MKKKIIAACAAAALAAVVLTGCGQRTDDNTTADSTAASTETSTEAAVQVISTEASTENSSESASSSPVTIEAVTEETQSASTEPVFTEPATEAVEEVTEETTESKYPDLSVDEELESESDYDEPRTFYAKDDMNIRSTPSTEADDNIISSYDQGQEVTVTGETPSWYIISKDDGDGAYSGYVYKDTLSEAEVETKSAEERARINAAYSGETSADGSSSGSYEVTMAADANIRESADGNANIVGGVPAGETVTVYSEEGEWLYITYDGISGYINRNLIEQ